VPGLDQALAMAFVAVFSQGLISSGARIAQALASFVGNVEIVPNRRANLPHKGRVGLHGFAQNTQ